MTRIGIIVGSTRPNRRGALVARWVSEHAQPRGDAEYEVVDLAEIALPILDEPEPAAMGTYHHSHTLAWSQTVAGFDGFVFVTPEYNHSVPAALKNAIDYLALMFEHRRRRQPQRRQMRIHQALVRAVVIHHRHPLADDRLQLVQVEEGLRFRVQAAGVDIRALVAGQRLQQVLAQRSEEPFHRALVAASA